MKDSLETRFCLALCSLSFGFIVQEIINTKFGGTFIIVGIAMYAVVYSLIVSGRNISGSTHTASPDLWKPENIDDIAPNNHTETTSINPATGLGTTYGIDSAGNPYGTDYNH